MRRSPWSKTPALVLMDMTMPILSGLQANCQIIKAFPTTSVPMLSAHCDEAYIVEAINSGAMGYLIKQTSSDNVCTAIREIQSSSQTSTPFIAGLRTISMTVARSMHLA